jgi:hypothetical protein
VVVKSGVSVVFWFVDVVFWRLPFSGVFVVCPETVGEGLSFL